MAFVAALSTKSLFLSVITIGEIAKGIGQMPEGRKKETLAAWFRNLSTIYQDRILGIDQETAEIWGELSAAAQRQGHSLPAADGLIAATAQRHGLHGATRDTRDFALAGVMIINPWLAPVGSVQ
jgi:predicted nucleic acid-binding protein